jgi:ACT domain-containing protein
MDKRYILIAEEFQSQVISELLEIKQLIKLNLNYDSKSLNSDLMDTADAVQYLKCNRRTLYKYRQKGLPCQQKENGKIYYWRSEIDKYFGKNNP